LDSGDLAGGVSQSAPNPAINQLPRSGDCPRPKQVIDERQNPWHTRLKRRPGSGNLRANMNSFSPRPQASGNGARWARSASEARLPDPPLAAGFQFGANRPDRTPLAMYIFPGHGTYRNRLPSSDKPRLTPDITEVSGCLLPTPTLGTTLAPIAALARTHFQSAPRLFHGELPRCCIFTHRGEVSP